LADLKIDQQQSPSQAACHNNEEKETDKNIKPSEEPTSPQIIPSEEEPIAETESFPPMFPSEEEEIPGIVDTQGRPISEEHVREEVKAAMEDLESTATSGTLRISDEELRLIQELLMPTITIHSAASPEHTKDDWLDR